jgi:cobyrinic acid a,c-diamide synthase
MSCIMISAAHKSSGKTTLSIGLCAALRARGLVVQPYKKGPDYIDPLWLSEAAGRPCHNLDFYTQSADEILAAQAYYSADANVSLIEGNKGLFDGLELDGGNSNAALANLLGAPVVLVLDSRGMTRGVAPLLVGYQQFDAPKVKISGVILNQVGGARHEGKLRAVIEYYTDIPVLGAVARNPEFAIVERHLGLMPSNEADAAEEIVAKLRQTVENHLDLARLLDLAAGGARVPAKARPAPPVAQTVRIGIIRDEAFGFYYPGDLDALRAAGAELVFLDALRDPVLPPLDGLFIGGGFPETQAARLAANIGFKQSVATAVANGLPVYAECGGLMYLGRQLHWHGASHDLCAALPLDTRMDTRPQGRGYVHLRETGAGLWPLRNSDGALAQFKAHEFHYSRVENLAADAVFAYDVMRGHGIDGKHDGLIYKNTLACYAHLRHVADNPWGWRFVDFVRTTVA